MACMMRTWRERFLRKAASNRGDTLVEALTAILIGGLALLMLAQTISAASGIITRSQQHMDGYYAQAKTLATVSGNKGTLTLTESDSSVYVGDRTSDSASIDITWYGIEESGKGVICYV